MSEFSLKENRTGLIILFLLAFLLRLYGAGAFQFPTGDENMHVVSARTYAERGDFGADNWYHPPLKHLLLYGSIKLFGQNPYGWKMRNILLGALTVPVVFSLAMLLFKSKAVSFISAGLLLLDPLHIEFSRTTFEDVPAIFFLMLGILFAWKALARDSARHWLAAGIAFGFAVALRLYCINALVVLCGYAVFNKYRENNLRSLIAPMSFLIILPFCIYLLSYLPWFTRGYSLPELLAMQLDAFRELRTVRQEGFNPILNQLGSPSEWFTKFIAVGFEVNGDRWWGSYIVIMNNFPVWLLIPPSMFVLLYASIRGRNAAGTFLFLSFFVLYLPFLIVDRPIFLYSSLPLLPFGFLAVGYAAHRVLNRWTVTFGAVSGAWSLILYPLVTGISVPLPAYRFVLSFVKILERPHR
jgi:dolichyl-phosphate-mannose--protein O-mannosyl transferase